MDKHSWLCVSFATKKKTLKELQVKLELLRLKINYDSTTLLALKTRIIMSIKRTESKVNFLLKKNTIFVFYYREGGDIGPILLRLIMCPCYRWKKVAGMRLRVKVDKCFVVCRAEWQTYGHTYPNHIAATLLQVMKIGSAQKVLK